MRSTVAQANHADMTVKDGWDPQEPVPMPSPLPIAAEVVIARAARLNRDEIELLDHSESSNAAFRLVAWDVLRSGLAGGEVGAMRLVARDRAWAAVNQSLSTIDVAPLPGDDYWRVTTGFGWGAARAARFAACTLVAPDRLDPDIAEMLLGPWLALGPDGLIGDRDHV